MAEISSILTAGLIGLLSGFVVSIPVGPINLAIINEGATRGFRWAVLIGTGALAMDVIYCGIAFAGFAGLFTTPLAHAAMELLSFLAVTYLGVKYLVVPDLPATTKGVERVEHRLHPHTAFMTGFVRVLGNPGILLFWITLAATFISHEWIDDTGISKLACVVGMSAGAFGWFVFLSFLVSLGHGRFSKRTLLWLSHCSGAALLLMACVIATRLIRILAHH